MNDHEDWDDESLARVRELLRGAAEHRREAERKALDRAAEVVRECFGSGTLNDSHRAIAQRVIDAYRPYDV